MVDTITAVGHASEETRCAVRALPGVRAAVDEATGALRLTARLGNVRVTVEADGRLRLFGSLTKLALGSNAKNAARRDVQRAVRILSDALCFDPDHARVYRVDVGATLVVPRPPALYLALLDSAPRHKRGRYDSETVRFQAGRSKRPLRVLSFYDKQKEAAAGAPAGGAVPEGHLLRYEVQFRRRVKAQLGQAVALADLCAPVLYDRLVHEWVKRYASVRKAARPVFEPTGSTRAFKEQLAAFGLRACGSSSVRASIQAWQAESDVTRKQACRLKKAVRELACNGGSVEDVRAAEELDEAVRRVAERAGVERERDGAARN